MSLDITAWKLHREGRTDEAVRVLSSALVKTCEPGDIASLAYARAQILIDSNRCPEAEAGLREVLGLPPETTEAEFPSVDLMECLFTCMAIGGRKVDLAVIRWLLTDCQDQGHWSEALNYAGILIASLPESSRTEAMCMAECWKREAADLGEGDHVKGLHKILVNFRKGNSA